MELHFRGEPMEKPVDLSLKASLTWNYFSINNGGWVAAETGDGAILVTDESCYLHDGYCFCDFDSFCEWLEQSAEDSLRECPDLFLSAAFSIPESLLTPEVESALIDAIAGSEKQEQPGSTVQKEPAPEPEQEPEPPKEQKYTVGFIVDGRCFVDVCATSPEEAREKAQTYVDATDFGKIVDDIDTIRDEAGNLVYES